MKRQFDFPVGSIIDDMKVVDTSKPYRGSIRYVVKCEKCGRIKSMLGATINRHSGTTHKSCGKGLKLQDKKFHQMWRGLRTRTKANQRKSIHGTIRFPDGILRSFPCLGQFLRYNPELDLNYSCMRDLMSGRISTYKGITVVDSSILVKCND